MIKKRNTNLEARKKGFFFTGALIALGLSLLAFEWRTGDLLPEEMALYGSLNDSMGDEKGLVDVKRVFNPPTPVIEEKGDVEEVDTVVNEIVYQKDTSDNQLVFNPNLPFDTIGDEPPTFILDTTIPPKRYVDRPAEYLDGHNALMKYLKEKTIYPPEAIARNQQDRIYLEFVVDEKGNASQFTILKGKYKLLNREAIRVAKGMGKWKPAELNGKKVPSYFKLPMVFRLD